MSRFTDAMLEKNAWTKTTNGADARSSTGNPLVDMFGAIGSMRNVSDDEVIKKYVAAYNFDKNLAMKLLFYARDIRANGCGEREVFRKITAFMANLHPESVAKNIRLIPEYGRWDDLYCLVGTKLEDDMWDFMREQFYNDLANSKDGKPISLLAKWMKSVNTSSKESVKLGCLTARKMGMKYPVYQKALSNLRKQIRIVEQNMSANEWDKINYEAVPSNAMTKYRSAFGRHDSDGFGKYLADVKSGVKKVNASTLYPYNLIEKYMTGNMTRGTWNNHYMVCEAAGNVDEVVEAQWKALPNYIDKDANILVMADTSGSMRGRPIATAIGLAIYFAERNKGEFHNKFMTFSGKPKFVELNGDTLYEKVLSAVDSEWGRNTNVKAALEMILNVGIQSRLSDDEMPKALCIVSDMNFDWACVNVGSDFYETVKKMYEDAGYTMPNIVFWNVNGSGIYHSRYDVKGVQMYSGQAAGTFKNVIDAIGYNAEEAMLKALNSPRYEAVVA